MIRITHPDQIGPVLADLRAMHGLTQHELATEAGVSAPRMNNWEHGTLNPTTPTLLKLLGALGLGLAIVPVDETSAVDPRWERLIETLAHHIRLTVRGEIETAPETAPGSTLADDHPASGVPVGPEGLEIATEAPAPCGCPVRRQQARIVSHTRECSDREAGERLARHLADDENEPGFCCNRHTHPGHADLDGTHCDTCGGPCRDESALEDA